jgi:DNA-binding NtrC family response regulator
MSDSHIAEMNVVLCGLEAPLAAQLTEAVSRFANVRHVRSAGSIPECVGYVERTGAGVVFCGADPRHYCALLKALKRRSLKPNVVVASRLPDVSAWLHALEHGAANYCAAPFEACDIRWILEAALGAWPVVFA